MLTNIVRMFSPRQLIKIKLHCASKRLRAAVFEVLPLLWKRHKESVNPIFRSLQDLDAEYQAYNQMLFKQMESWVVQIE